METYTDRDARIDAIRRRFGISLETAAKYNSQNRDEIKNSGQIFRLNGKDKEKTLALLYMVSSDEQDDVIQKFRNDAGLNDESYSPALLVTQYGTMLAAALIYHPHLYAMAVNYYGAVSAGFSVAEITKDAINKNKKNKILPFPVNSRVVFATATAAAVAVVFFITIVVRLNQGAGQRVVNDWISGLMEPNKGQDGVSFISEGNEGARVGIRSPLVGIAMSAANTKNNLSGATEYYTRSIKTEKNNAALYVNRGIAYTLQGYVDAAITDFNKAVELDPNNTSAYFNRSAAFMGKGDAEMAESDLMTIISINSGDSEAYYALGVLYFKQYENDMSKPRVLLEKSLDAFSRIQGYKDADLIFDYLSRLL